MKTNKIIYWIATGVMTLIFTFSSSMYLLKYDMVSGFYNNLGFPTWIIYPLAILKILGLLAVWTRKNKLLKEWAYAGFFYDAVLAFFAHYMISDGEWPLSVIAIIAIIISRVYEGKVFSTSLKPIAETA
ncbi:DoxX family protein [Flavivirga rizhaonensis]|uniref:DoxX family protein n=1 Tax=Flavivirga rizhaonensis TaxID=2559571 RepID=A0A4S1DU28_9FLAO|nr:DoxX family protein [Flavivirga rizhaonensis]TGV01315.1 DoxX family protein [Flavivirga rizhaonensis]